MKICHFTHNQAIDPTPRLGILLDEKTLIDPQICLAVDYEREGFSNPIERAKHKMPSSLYKLLKVSDNPIEELHEAYGLYLFLKMVGDTALKAGTPIAYKIGNEVRLNKPLDKIEVYRDFYAHEKHVKKGFEKRKEAVPETWYEIPVYYKGATSGFIGPQEEILWPYYTDKLDYELELAAVVGRDGKNVKVANADQHIFGFTILNDVSARDIQKKEMAVRLGPSKGKDFCSVIGPVIVTYDEFEYEEPNLLMTAKINGEEWSRGQSKDAHFRFAEMLEFASREEWVLAGDLLGSGTVGTGCGLELDRWIQEGDEIELEVETIGKLVNKVGKKDKFYG